MTLYYRKEKDDSRIIKELPAGQGRLLFCLFWKYVGKCLVFPLNFFEKVQMKVLKTADEDAIIAITM